MYDVMIFMQGAARLRPIRYNFQRTKPQAFRGRSLFWDRGFQLGMFVCVILHLCSYEYTPDCQSCVFSTLTQTLSLFPARILKLLEFAGFSGDKVFKI